MIRTSLFAALALLPLAAAAAEKLNVRPGLWEITSTTHMSGMVPLPKELRDKLTPKQKADMEAAYKAESAKPPETETERECITEKELERPFESADSDSCTQTIVNTTRTSQEVRLVCTGDIKGSGLFKVSTPTPTTMAATLDLRAGEGKEQLVIKGTMKGRWLGADCGELAEEEYADSEEGEEDNPSDQG